MSRRVLQILAIVAAVAVVYRHAPAAYFFEDDFQWLMSTWSFHPANVLNLSGYRHFYRPVIELYFWAAAPLFGGSPRLFHLANVALHAANGVLLLILGRQISRSDRLAATAAVLFVVLPGYVHAVVWVGALAEPIAAFFGCLAMSGFLRFRKDGRRAWRAASLLAFALALLTHESSVVMLPILALADWAAEAAGDPGTTWSARAWGERLRLCLPYAALVIVYLLIDIPISRRSYLIDEGHYRIGLHAVRNVFNYLVSLYVGKKNAASYAGIAVVLAWLLIRGTPMARFAMGWMLLALLPFSFFTWGNQSRYLYLPGMGFALLLGEAVEWSSRSLARRLSRRTAAAAVAVAVGVVTIRFMVFASKGVDDFAELADGYRRYLTSFRQAHPQLPGGSAIPLDRADDAALHHKFLEAMVQWEYRDPTITLVPR